jgi:glycosyltransferase involved in cell wall biosynthesis
MSVKVCHVISGYIRDNGRVFQRQCKSLQKFGFEVSLLTNDGEIDEIKDGIRIYSCKRFWKNRFKVLFFAKYQFLESAINIDADIYQLHSPELISLGLSLQKIGKKVVYDAHEDLPRHILEKEWLPLFSRKFISFFVEKFMRRYLSKYNHIISPHLHVINDLKSINSSCTLITNFPIVNTKRSFSLNKYLAREKTLCYTGTVYEYSNQEFILKALNDISDLKYRTVGYISDQQLDQLSNIKSYSRCNFGALIPFNQMNNFYDNTIIGIVVYDYKLNLGNKLGSYGTNKIFEYMEAGIPFICTDYELWKLIIDKYNCGIYVEPQNTNQIRDALNFLLTNPEKAYEMGQNGRKAVMQEYNWEKEEISYIEIFKEI